jgi:hypothetical protein
MNQRRICDAGTEATALRPILMPEFHDNPICALT